MPPRLHSTFGQQTLRPGPAVSLQCVASGNPPPSISWSLDTQPVTLTTTSNQGDSFVDRSVLSTHIVNIYYLEYLRENAQTYSFTFTEEQYR